MEIKVLGSGCSKCRVTIGMIERVARDLGVAVEIVKVQSPEEIQRHGVQATPAVIIDGKIVHSGGLPSHDEIQGWLKPGPMGFLNQADTTSVLHRQRRRRKNVAVDRSGTDPGGRGQEGSAGQHRRGVEPG